MKIKLIAVIEYELNNQEYYGGETDPEKILIQEVRWANWDIRDFIKYFPYKVTGEIISR